MTSIDQLLSVPVLCFVSSVISSFQVPCTCFPSTADRFPSGRNVPVNGAVPRVIDVVASSSRTVFVKFLTLGGADIGEQLDPRAVGGDEEHVQVWVAGVLDVHLHVEIPDDEGIGHSDLRT